MAISDRPNYISTSCHVTIKLSIPTGTASLPCTTINDDNCWILSDLKRSIDIELERYPVGSSKRDSRSIANLTSRNSSKYISQGKRLRTHLCLHWLRNFGQVICAQRLNHRCICLLIGCGKLAERQDAN